MHEPVRVLKAFFHVVNALRLMLVNWHFHVDSPKPRQKLFIFSD